jgi:MFS family permease
VLGFVSLFMDVSSESIHSILPMFLVTGLGVGVVTVGLIEGVAEATAQVTKAFSGALSDRLGKRKLLAVVGYGVAALTKPIFPLATGAGWVLAARFVDRLGKGIRGAPRDALIADIAPVDLRGASYGLRQALDTVGALMGPLLAVGLLMATAGDFRAVMWVAVIPAAISVAVLVVGVEEPAIARPEKGARLPLRPKDLARLGRAYWGFVVVAGALMFSRFSEAFLLLRADGLGLATPLVPLVFVAMNVVFAVSSFPAGRLSDRLGRRGLVAVGFGVLVVAHGILALAVTPAHVFLGAAAWGLHLGLTQGVLSAMVADVVPARLRGTGFGLFHMGTGLAMLAGSMAAGLLWDLYGAAVPFAVGAGVAALALAAFLARPPVPTS